MDGFLAVICNPNFPIIHSTYSKKYFRTCRCPKRWLLYFVFLLCSPFFLFYFSSHDTQLLVYFFFRTYGYWKCWYGSFFLITFLCWFLHEHVLKRISILTVLNYIIERNKNDTDFYPSSPLLKSYHTKTSQDSLI